MVPNGLSVELVYWVLGGAGLAAPIVLFASSYSLFITLRSTTACIYCFTTHQGITLLLAGGLALGIGITITTQCHSLSTKFLHGPCVDYTLIHIFTHTVFYFLYCKRWKISFCSRTWWGSQAHHVFHTYPVRNDPRCHFCGVFTN